MKRRYFFIGVLVVLLSGALAYFYGGGQAPAGQQPLRSLTPQTIGELKTEFNAAKDDVRVLLLLSPT
jgi:hypothetical protein